MPDSNSPYMASGTPHALEMLKGQLISATEDRRRVMLWSAILALGSLMLLGHVASVPWFLALVPLSLLAIWNACLLVRQRQFQAVWDGLMEKAGDPKSSAATRTAAMAISARELGARDVPAVLSALVAPSVLLFHGLLLGAVVTGGVVHEVDHDTDGNTHIARGKSESMGSACGCGGGASVTAKSPPQAVRPTNSTPPRNFSNAPARPQQGPPHTPYPTRQAPMTPPGQTRVLVQPQPAPAGPTPPPQATGAAPAPSANPSPGPLPAPGPALAAPVVGPAVAPPAQVPAPALPSPVPPPAPQAGSAAPPASVSPTTSARTN